ncbi:MAG: RNase P subunit p30 family protein [Nanoarchaeota archaeon]|nr:RNase P subunit p30 family protein [Nanoarchaeota archaeon]
MDIAIPKNNEAEFIEIASKLGIKKLYFLYDFDNYNEENIQKKLNLINKNIDIGTGFIVNQKNLNKAFKESRLLVVKSSDRDRFFIETQKIGIIYGFEEVYQKDYLHQRMSGLNHTLCNLANKNNVAIGFAYSSLFSKSSKLTSLIMGRMMQNIVLCQKYKVKTVIGSFSENPYEIRALHDVTSLFIMLGINGKVLNRQEIL